MSTLNPQRWIDQKIVVCIAFVVSGLMGSIDATVVNVALATLSRQFKIPADSVDGVVVGYLVSLAIVIPASGWLGDRWGTKRSFLLAVGIFTIASALCGMASSFGELVVFRVLQGVGGGMLLPVGQTMLYRAYPPSERVHVSRILIFPRILGPACGPVLGGFLVDALSWRWVFYVNVPIGVAAFFFSLVFLREQREEHPGRFDMAGFALAGLGFAALMYAISEGPLRGWTSPLILAGLLVGLVLLTIFVLVELKIVDPMVELRLLKDKLFTTTNLVTVFSGAAFSGILFLVPLFLQEARGQSAFSSGLTTFPEAIGVVVSTQLVAYLYHYFGPRRLMAGGLVLVAAGMTLLCTIQLGTSDWWVRLFMFIIGVGMAYVFLPAQAAGFATISSADTGRASTLYTVQRRLGSAAGVAVLSTVLASFGSSTASAAGIPQPNLTAYQIAFIASALLAVIAAGFALIVPDRDAVETMQPSGPAVWTRYLRRGSAATEAVETEKLSVDD